MYSLSSTTVRRPPGNSSHYVLKQHMILPQVSKMERVKSSAQPVAKHSSFIRPGQKEEDWPPSTNYILCIDQLRPFHQTTSSSPLTNRWHHLHHSTTSSPFNDNISIRKRQHHLHLTTPPPSINDYAFIDQKPHLHPLYSHLSPRTSTPHTVRAILLQPTK